MEKIIAKVILAVLMSVNAITGVYAAEAGVSASKAPTEFTKRENAEYMASPLNYNDVRDAELVKRVH
jgi:hypothetical protein